jgi:hypothetical protein
MENLSTIILSVIGIIFAIILFYVVLLLVELRAVMRDFRKVADRIEMLTDVKGWFHLISKFTKKDKKKE